MVTDYVFEIITKKIFELMFVPFECIQFAWFYLGTSKNYLYTFCCLVGEYAAAKLIV